MASTFAKRREDQPRRWVNRDASSLLPLLLLTGLLVQSVAESRLLVEFGFAFLVVIAIKTKAPDAATFERAPTGTTAR